MVLKRFLFRGGIYVFAAFFALLCLMPYLWIVSASLRTELEMFSNPFGLPKNWRFSNYSDAWTLGKFGPHYKNTVVITVMSVALMVPTVSLAAYPLAKMEFYAKKFLMTLLLAGLVIPFHAIMISLYYVLRSVRLLNTYLAMVLPLVAIHISFGTFYMRAFFIGLPSSLVEAAKMDGCSSLQAVVHIVVPLSKAAVTTLGVFQCVWSWNAFVIPLIYNTKASFRPVTVGLMYFQGRQGIDYSLMTAGVVIVSLPLLFVFMVFRRGFVRGVTGGAIK